MARKKDDRKIYAVKVNFTVYLNTLPSLSGV